MNNIQKINKLLKKANTYERGFDDFEEVTDYLFQKIEQSVAQYIDRCSQYIGKPINEIRDEILPKLKRIYGITVRDIKNDIHKDEEHNEIFATKYDTIIESIEQHIDETAERMKINIVTSITKEIFNT